MSLRRITSRGAYIPEVDGLRFVAIASVVWYHVALKAETVSGQYVWGSNFVRDFFMNLVMHGFQGVGVFFVISGFVLGLPFAQSYLSGTKPVNLRAYLLRRITRLEPPYIANLLMRMPLIPAAKHMTMRQVMPHFLASLVYMHVIIYGYQPLVHWGSWSLEIEVQFYLLAPLIALVVFRCSPILRRASLVSLSVFAGLLQNHLHWGPRFDMSILNYWQFFLSGFLVADLYTTVLPRWRQSWVWDVVSVPLWLLIFSVSIKTAHVLIPPVAIVLFVAAFKGSLSKWFFRLPAVCTVGGMCYSIYLTHPLIMDSCYAVLIRFKYFRPFWPDLIIGEIIVSAAVLVGGAAYFVVIERPCMDKNWPHKLVAWVDERNPFSRVRRAALSVQQSQR